MAKIRYKCDDCSHEFDGNDFTDECPKCSSRNIVPLSSTSAGGVGDTIKNAQEFIKNNKIVVGIIALVIVLLLFFSKCGDEPKVEYDVKIIQPEDANYLEVKMTRMDEETNKQIDVPAKKILTWIEKKVIINNGDPVDIQDDNRIYLCPNHVGNVRITITPKPLTKLKGLSENKKTKVESCNFNLDGISESDKAGCAALPLQQSEVRVVSEKGCKLKVVVSRDLKGKSAFISVTGQDGTYENKTIWDRKSLINKKQDVWVVIEGNDKSTATPATGNGDIIPDGDCTPKDYSKLIDEFKKLANEFGRDPQNRSAQRLFQAFLNQKFTIQVIYLNNVLVDINELQNKMRVNAANDGKQYRLQGEPTISTDGTTITFRFIEM
jgi:DNA-directed RNA polymerase subunit RPC12/RpoP